MLCYVEHNGVLQSQRLKIKMSLVLDDGMESFSDITFDINFFGLCVNSGHFTIPLFPQRPKKPVKSGNMDRGETVDTSSIKLLTAGSLVRAQQGEPLLNVP